MARFMLFIYPGITEEEYAAGPQLEDVEAMMRYNDELSKAGALLAGDGLLPEVSRVARGGVTDGPFSESKELVGGWGIVEAESKEEAVQGIVGLLELHRQYWPGWEGEAEVRQMVTQGAPAGA